MADQTVGNSSVGAVVNTVEGYAFAAPYTTPAVAGGGTCTFNVRLSGSAPYPRVTLAVWADNAGQPGALLATGPEIAIDQAARKDYSGTFEWNGIQANTQYWLGGVGESTAGVGSIVLETVTGRSRYAASGYSVPDPFPAPTTGNSNYRIWVTYPEGAPPSRASGMMTGYW